MSVPGHEHASDQNGAMAGLQLKPDNAICCLRSSFGPEPVIRAFGRTNRVGPEADCLVLVATYGEADTHYENLRGSFVVASDPLLPFSERLPNGVT
jgi:hypothetical protein